MMNIAPSDVCSAKVFPKPSDILGGLWWLKSRRFFTLRFWLTTFAMGVLLAAFASWAVPAQSSAMAFAGWIQSYYLGCLVPILTFVSAAGAFRDDLGAGSSDYLFTRPVGKGLFVVFRVLVQTLCMQVDFLFAFGVLLALGLSRDVTGLIAFVPSLLLGQIILVTLFTAFGVLCAVLTSRYVMVGLVYGGVVELGLGKLPTQISQLSMTHHVLHLVQLFQPRLPAAPRLSTGTASGDAGDVVWIVVFLVGTISIAALVFARQERSGGRSQDI